MSTIEADLINGTPIADVLRKLVLLGGQAGSAELRHWASQELRGYRNIEADALPDYRRVPAVLQVDAIVGYNMITGQSIDPQQLPEGPREFISNSVPFFQGIGEIQAMCATDKRTVKLSVPSAQLLGQLMDKQAGQPFQRITEIYWGVSVAAIEGLLDQVKTRLVELLAELRASTPRGAELPTATQAAKAVNIVVHGRGNRIQLAQASGEAQAENVGGARASDVDEPFWTLGKRIGAGIVGVATIVGTVIAIIQVNGGS
jgi:hypothetical protein